MESTPAATMQAGAGTATEAEPVARRRGKNENGGGSQAGGARDGANAWFARFHEGWHR
ncbi:hypothetical protein [Pandoraea faecigallinarum]|uniref:hypothetical protein n=1 Tax=Pandoraea faecigallinarum TaxID=656179 RepID=UPI0012F4EE41|nr:hypothetical protein [Pandoraea faecigallinarum]